MELSSRARLILANQEAEMLQDMHESFPGDVSLSLYLMFGLELEDQQ